MSVRALCVLRALCAIALAALASACASGPPAPGWAVATEAAARRASAATLGGVARVERLEWERAAAEVARTARPDLAAQLQLLRCAVQSAALLWQDCPAWAGLAQDGTPAQAAYARYLAAQPAPGDQALLNPAHGRLAGVLLGGGEQDPQAAQEALEAVRAVEGALPRLVAASVALRAGLGSPALLQLGVDTASAEGWSRALMAWLLLQARALAQAGDAVGVQAVQRRLEVLHGHLPPPEDGADSADSAEAEALP